MQFEQGELGKGKKLSSTGLRTFFTQTYGVQRPGMQGPQLVETAGQLKRQSGSGAEGSTLNGGSSHQHHQSNGETGRRPLQVSPLTGLVYPYTPTYDTFPC